MGSKGDGMLHLVPHPDEILAGKREAVHTGEHRDLAREKGERFRARPWSGGISLSILNLDYSAVR